MTVPRYSPAAIGRAIGARIAATRTAMGLTQQQLAAATGVTMFDIDRLETYGQGTIQALCLCLLILQLGDEIVDALTCIQPVYVVPKKSPIPGRRNLSAQQKAERQARIAAEAPGWQQLLQEVAELSKRFDRNGARGAAPEEHGEDEQ